MDIEFELEEEHFRWNAEKAASNVGKHGVSFEIAASVFFDPALRLIDAERHEEARYAAIGMDTLARVLYVVHIENDVDGFIRIISARTATATERKIYGDS